MTSMFDALRTAARKRQEYNGIVAELEALTDRDLYDIGMVRADARRIARNAVYGN